MNSILLTLLIIFSRETNFCICYSLPEQFISLMANDLQGRNLVFLTDGNNPNDETIFALINSNRKTFDNHFISHFKTEAKDLDYICEAKNDFGMVIYFGSEQTNLVQNFSVKCSLNTKWTWLFPKKLENLDHTFRYNIVRDF